MDMEALIVTNRLALCTAHPDLNNRGGLDLIGYLFIDKKILKTKKPVAATGHLAGARNTFIFFRLQAPRTSNAGQNAACSI